MCMEDKIQLLYELKDQINKYRPLPVEDLKVLNDDFAVDYTYNTNAIEGSTISLNETYMLLNNNVTIQGKTLTEHLDIINHKEAYDYVVQLGNGSDPLTEKDIKDLHFLVLNNNIEQRGAYRNVNVRVGSHIAPEFFKVRELLQEALDDYNTSDLGFFEKVSKFHLDFETIHPFADGNGRTGRLIINLEIIKNGFLPINIKYNDVDEYYKSFDDYHKNGSIKTLLDLVVNYEKEELEARISLLRDREKYNDLER